MLQTPRNPGKLRLAAGGQYQPPTWRLQLGRPKGSTPSYQHSTVLSRSTSPVVSCHVSRKEASTLQTGHLFLGSFQLSDPGCSAHVARHPCSILSNNPGFLGLNLIIPPSCQPLGLIMGNLKLMGWGRQNGGVLVSTFHAHLLTWMSLWLPLNNKLTSALRTLLSWGRDRCSGERDLRDSAPGRDQLKTVGQDI